MIGPAAVGAAAHAFVADLERPRLSDADRHHLERVLRLRGGEVVTVADGRGRWRTVEFGTVLVPTGPVQWDRPGAAAVAVALALLKGERLELAVQKLTEIGVDWIGLFPAGRSVARWDGGRQGRHLERLTRVVQEAGMQCRRSRLPELRWFDGFALAAATPGACRADGGEAAGPVTLEHPVVLVGPEGGWTDDERALQLPVVSLGPHVLRAETAALVAGALLVVRRTLEV